MSRCSLVKCVLLLVPLLSVSACDNNEKVQTSASVAQSGSSVAVAPAHRVIFDLTRLAGLFSYRHNDNALRAFVLAPINSMQAFWQPSLKAVHSGASSLRARVVRNTTEHSVTAEPITDRYFTVIAQVVTPVLSTASLSFSPGDESGRQIPDNVGPKLAVVQQALLSSLTAPSSRATPLATSATSSAIDASKRVPPGPDKFTLYTLVALLTVLFVWLVKVIVDSGYDRLFGDIKHFKTACRDVSLMPEAQRWAMAVGAPYAFVNHYHWARRVINRNSKKADSKYKDFLQMLSVWGIDDRRTLLDVLPNLLKHGHRAVYEAQIQDDSAMPQAEYDDFSRWLSRDAKTNSDAKERLWQLNTARKNARDIRQIDFCAWDMMRFVMLCRSGAQLGFISEKEMVDFATLAAVKVQRHYPGWQEMARHFMLARWYWTSTDINHGINHPSFKKAVNCLLRLRISPWQTLRWDTPLPDSNEDAFAKACGVSRVFYQHERQEHEAHKDTGD